MSVESNKGSFLTGLFWTLGILIVSTMIAVWITGYTYIYKTLIYTYPDIDDIDIFDTRIVNDSGPQPWPFSVEYNKINLPSTLTDELVKYETVAFLVVRNDSIVYEQYAESFENNTLSNSFLVSKSIIGVLTGIALGEKLFTLDDPVGKYIPKFAEGKNSELKVRHLLTMSSGLNWDESYSNLFSPTTEAYYGTKLEKQVTRLKVKEEPGKTFRYMSCNTVLLALIISKTSGMTISEYAAQKLWKQIGATQPAYWSLDHFEGLEKSYCCFYSTARDFAKIGKLYLDSGKWMGRSIVSPEFVRESLQPVENKDASGTAVDYYGYHWWLMNEGTHKIYYARGIYGQYIIVIPDERMIIVRLGKQRGEKLTTNHYNDMVAYTRGVLGTFGSHPD